MKPDEVKKEHYYRMAKKAGYVSRAAFKLKQINRRYGIFRNGQAVLELGAAPGGWTQVASKEVGEAGKVVAVDRRPLKVDLANVSFVMEDALSWMPGEPFDVVLSDMSPNVTGVWEHDQYEQWRLATRALEIAERVLRRGGSFVCKVFDGEGAKALYERARHEFYFVKLTKPLASRAESSELYLVCKGYFGRRV